MVFHTASAAWSMPVGLGYVVARWCMILALGRLCGNVSVGMVVFGVDRKDWVMGPQYPCGSMAIGMSIVFPSRRSLMMTSPGMVRCVLFVGSPTVLLSRMYFLFSNSCRWESAAAVNFCWTSAVNLSGGEDLLLAMVMSAPIME